MSNSITLFHIDQLSLIMLSLIMFVGIAVALFCSRYLRGNNQQTVFYRNLALMIGSVLIMVCTDHILLLTLTWATSNWILTRLMLHKASWQAAKHASNLAAKSFTLGTCMLGTACLILFIVSGETSIQRILNTPIENTWLICSATLILLAAMTQSGIWPFHRWLISSLNAPTPASAIMHAGLVNGGGFLLTRFSPLLLKQTHLLNAVFMIGMTTAIIGTLWKLMQSDIKRMLACSTMGQMGFMIAQCGLGLFPAAVAHLCWHGLFKAYLFLRSSSAAQERRLTLSYPPTLKHFSLALLSGGMGAIAFMISAGKAPPVLDTNLLLIIIAGITATQLALPIICNPTPWKIPTALIATTVIGTLHGYSVKLIEHSLAPMQLALAQPINLLHVIGLCTLALAWLWLIFRLQRKHQALPAWALKVYVRILNASQPHPNTITAHRTQYQY